MVAKCLHQLTGPTNDKKLKSSKGKPLLKTQQDQFDWWEEHQKAFDKLSDALTNAPVLAYLDFSKPFELETDASLSALGTVLIQRDQNSHSRFIANASHTLHPNEKLMCNSSSAKLELLALKWAVTKRLCDYLLGYQFTVLKAAICWHMLKKANLVLLKFIGWVI